MSSCGTAAVWLASLLEAKLPGMTLLTGDDSASRMLMSGLASGLLLASALVSLGTAP